jgi:L,D-transpeptidase YcbB
MLAALVSCLLLQAPTQPVAKESLRARVEQLHDAPSLVVRGVKLRRPDAVVHFFEKRGFVAAWPLPAAAGGVRQAIADAEADGLRPADYHLAAIDALLASRQTAPQPALDDDLQIVLTDAVAALIDDLRYGKVLPVTLDKRWNVDARTGASPLEDEVAGVAAAASPAAAIGALKPTHFIYVGLKDALAKLRAVTRAGGWPAVPAGPAIKPGMTNRRVAAIRKRLASTGELPNVNTLENETYDDELREAVKRFQERHRLTADGAIGPATVQAMNVTAETRIGQLRVNMERARWVVGGLRDSFVLVNLPAFKVYLIRNRMNVWESRTQIGREARQTPTFRADMRYLVFNPDWTVPPTILAQDVLGGMRKGENTIVAVTRTRQRAWTREVHLPERTLDFSPRYAEPGTLRVRQAHVQFGVHSRGESARVRHRSPRWRWPLESPADRRSHCQQQDRDGLPQGTLAGTDRVLDRQRRRIGRATVRPRCVQTR